MEILTYITTWLTLENMLSERSQSLRGAKGEASNQVFIVFPARCSLSIRDYIYHKHTCLVKYITCQLLLACQGNRARKLTKGQTLTWEVKRYCYLLALRRKLNSLN